MDDHLVGKNLGPCRIVRFMAKGGMGHIYEGRHIALDKRVAVKVLDPLYAADSNFVQRFVREARAAAKLDHPNIVQVLDVGGEQNVYYIVMQYVDGTSLDHIADRAGRLTPEMATKWIREVVRGLEAAHCHGIIHRDVKPGNILVQRDGAVKITDFGLARFGTAPSASSTKLTVEGSFMGTPEYVSPEQSRGGYLDGRADLYSLGITYYRLLGGDVPFHGESAVELAYMHIHTPPVPIAERVPGLDPRISKLVSSLLEKDPARRPADAAVVLKSLDAILATPAPSAPRNTPPSAPKRLPPTPPARPRTPSTASWRVPPPPRPPSRLVPLCLFVGLLILAGALSLAPSLVGPTVGLEEPFRPSEPKWPIRAALLGGAALAFVSALVCYRRDLGHSGAGGRSALLLLVSLAGTYGASMTTNLEATNSFLLGLAVYLGLFGFVLAWYRDPLPWMPWFGRGLLVLALAFLYGFAIRDPSTGSIFLMVGGCIAGILGILLVTWSGPGPGRRFVGTLLVLIGAGLLLLYASAADAPPAEWGRRVAGLFAGYPKDFLARGLLVTTAVASAIGAIWCLAGGLARWRRYYP